jgi:hypothetical protein
MACELGFGVFLCLIALVGWYLLVRIAVSVRRVCVLAVVGSCSMIVVVRSSLRFSFDRFPVYVLRLL